MLMNSFSFNWGGVLGAAKFLFKQPLVDKMNVLQLGVGIPFPADGTLMQVAVTGLLLVCFMLLVIITPLLHAVCLIVFWALHFPKLLI